MTGARALLAALLGCASIFALGGCGDEGDGGEGTAAPEDETTKRVVVESQNGAFDAQAIYDAVAPGVVTVTSVFEGEAVSLLGGGRGQGSGFVISDDGEILTNAHVVSSGGRAGGGGPLEEADEVYIQFPDLNQVQAEIVGVDPYADVALLQVDPEELELTPLPLGSEDDVEVGEPVAAIGSPFGQDSSLSVGVVSAADRSIQGLTTFGIEGAIQTDASINPGNSGGPLLDAEGEVVGINQQIQTRSGGNEGVGFAVPIDLAQRSIDQLRREGEPSYAYIGVTTTGLYPQLAERLDVDVETGAIVAQVIPDSPADDAGLRGCEDTVRFQGFDVDVGGDVIVAIGDERVVDNSDLAEIIALHEPGDEVTVEVIRDGEHGEVEVTLEERPEDSTQRPPAC
jgi:S1-C subfamily serine protease